MSASKRRTSFEMEIDVNFMNEEQSLNHFIKGDWKDSFYTFNDLDELAEHISYAFHITSDEFRKRDGKHIFVKFIEGFGDFIRQENGSYELSEEPDEGGKIIVNYEMTLEPTGTYAP